MIWSVDIGRFPKVGDRYNITELPVMVVFQQTHEIHRFQGVSESKADQILEFLEKFLKTEEGI